MSSTRPLSLWVEKIQSKGRYTFTRAEHAEVESGAGRSFAGAQNALRPLKQQERIVSPRRGFCIVVLPECCEAGSPPASWCIDGLLRFMGQLWRNIWLRVEDLSHCDPSLTVRVLW